MRAELISIAVILAVVAGCDPTALSPEVVCEKHIEAQREKSLQCAVVLRSSGPFGIDEARCATIADAGCPLPDGGTGTFDFAQVARCTAGIRASSCGNGNNPPPTSGCGEFCR